MYFKRSNQLFFLFHSAIFWLKSTRQKQKAPFELLENCEVFKNYYSLKNALFTGPRRSFPRRPFVVMTGNYNLEFLHKVTNIVHFCTDKYSKNTYRDYTNYSKTKFANLLIICIGVPPTICSSYHHMHFKVKDKRTTVQAEYRYM
jgi:hypothetical protein